jgi:hypothetical protein
MSDEDIKGSFGPVSPALPGPLAGPGEATATASECKCMVATQGTLAANSDIYRADIIYDILVIYI